MGVLESHAWENFVGRKQKKGLIYASFNCSNYTFHGTSNAGRSWETSRLLCQSSSEGDLVSIEEEEERNFVKNIIKKLPVIKYFIGLKKENGKWKWLSNQTTVDSSQGKSPWAAGQPSKPKEEVYCAAIYGKYRSYLGRFDDTECIRRMKNAGHICEKAVSCTKYEIGTSLTKKAPQVTPVDSTTGVSSQVHPSAHSKAEIEWAASNPHATKEREKATSVHSTTRTPWKTQPSLSTAEIGSIASGKHATKERRRATSVHSATRTPWKTQPFPSTAEIGSIASESHATKERQKATSVHSTGRTPSKAQPFPSTAEIDSIVPEITHLEKADETSNLIVIIGSVLATFVLLGTGVALLLFLVYRSRKKGSRIKIERYQRQSNIIRLKGLDNMSQVEQKMDDCESLREVKRQDACLTMEEGDGESFLSIQESSKKRPKEALIEELSGTNSYSDPLHISTTTIYKPSKVDVKKDATEQHQVYAQIHSKQGKSGFHLDHVMQDLGEGPLHVIVDEENCKPSAAIPSAGLEKELTRDEDAIVKQNASGQDIDQCIDCVYAVVDKTKKKRPPTKPVPYQELVYADLSHSPKKSKNGRIHQESTATIYADIDHIKSSAMSDSTSQQENEVTLID
ncbi:uncharacterized protein [Acropora muricata]|uniref:uncharacterized protein isoform X2 n=1 Tax=Acropora muricata TaxID=159855 RepID=UPI0034E4B986